VPTLLGLDQALNHSLYRIITQTAIMENKGA
jgi:hypothetical protein